MKARARIATWQRLRQQPTWKLLAADNAPLTAALLQALLLDNERQLPASLLHERLARELEELRAHGYELPRTAHYWGDLDTHGLAILSRLRGHLPQVRSLLMDEATLLAHRNLWVEEPLPLRADAIAHLDADEQRIFHDLCGDRWSVRVRLEQERIDWGRAWPAILQVIAKENRTQPTA